MTNYKLKILFFLLGLAGITSCSKSPFTCEFSGEKEIKTVELEDFNSLEVNPQIELKIFHSTENKMTIETDMDVMKDIDYQIIDNKLVLTNHRECLIQNTDAVATITLYVDDINTIIANTDLDIYSGNLWQFNELKIICENNETGTNNIADFHLQVDIDKLDIIANGSSIFDISGSCRDLYVGFYGVNPVLNAKDLIARKIKVLQRSDADMHLYPVEEITGDLYGYGDIYLYHHPPVVNITEHYAGHIYFVN